jgi:hypothetical protein
MLFSQIPDFIVTVIASIVTLTRLYDRVVEWFGIVDETRVDRNKQALFSKFEMPLLLWSGHQWKALKW